MQLMFALSAMSLDLLHQLSLAPAHLAVVVTLKTVSLLLVGLVFIRTAVGHAVSVRLLLGPRLTRRTAAQLLLTAE